MSLSVAPQVRPAAVLPGFPTIRQRRVLVLFLLGSLLACINPAPVRAQGNLLLTPQRIVFEGNQRIQELNLANIGKDTARYLISLFNLRMKEDGSFEEIIEPDTGQRFADKWVRFFPHSVVLGPGESQAVKIQLLRPSAMEPGEYRSHFYFRAIPEQQPLGEKDTRADTSISVRLVAIFGISIPVIIRIGASTTQTSLSDLSITKDKEAAPLLNMIFHRAGNTSVYGDLTVYFIPNSGKSIQVGAIRGLAVYTPNTLRRFSMPLDNSHDIDYHSGKLSVVYTTPPSDRKSTTIAEGELVLH